MDDATRCFAGNLSPHPDPLPGGERSLLLPQSPPAVARRPQTRALLLLAAGAALGIVLAAAGLVGHARGLGDSLPSDAVAVVNGQVIRTEDYERVVGALTQDRRDGLADGDRRRVVDRLIDEELLLQRGLELGMARSDSRVRKDLTFAVIDSVMADVGDTQPSEARLRAFYDKRRDFFAGPGRLRVRQIFCRTPTNADAPMALDRAQQAVRRVRAGEDFDAVKRALGDPELAPLPDAPLPPTKLTDYLGPTAARTAAGLKRGAISDPVRSSTGYHVLQLLDREAGPAPSLDEIKPQVLAEYRRRAGDRALRKYLDDLRSRADVAVRQKLP